jgi:hypothetical protein
LAVAHRSLDVVRVIPLLVLLGGDLAESLLDVLDPLGNVLHFVLHSGQEKLSELGIVELPHDLFFLDDKDGCFGTLALNRNHPLDDRTHKALFQP